MGSDPVRDRIVVLDTRFGSDLDTGACALRIAHGGDLAAS